MRFLLDASVLVPLLLDYGEKLLDIDKVSLCTTDLTIYEIGNSLWKLASLLKTISLEDAIEIIEVLKDFVERKLIVVRFSELDLGGTIKLAVNKELTFYDSAYIIATENLEATLVTEDEELREKAKEYVNTMIYKQLKQIITA